MYHPSFFRQTLCCCETAYSPPFHPVYEKELAQINDIRGLLGETTTDTDAIYRKLDEMGVSMQFHSSKEFDEKMMDDTFVLEL